MPAGWQHYICLKQEYYRIYYSSAILYFFLAIAYRLRLRLHIPVNMTIPGQYRPSTAYITGPLQCVSNGPITFCTSFLYRTDTCSRYWTGNGPAQYGTGPVYPHTVLGQYRTGNVILYRFGTVIPGQYWPGNGSLQWGIGMVYTNNTL